MRKRQFESICNRLVADLPEFVCKGWLLYSRPVGPILRGFYCEGSSFDASNFIVTVFVLPLYVPTTEVHFNFGARLKDERGCEKWWSVNEPDLVTNLSRHMRKDGIPFLGAVNKPSDLVALISRLPGSTNPHSLEAIAYSLVLEDEVDSAWVAINQLASALDVKIRWQAEMMERVAIITQKLRADPSSAKRQLADWQTATVKCLGI